jgi:hypothetical protein
MLTFWREAGKLGNSRTTHEHGNSIDRESPDFAGDSLGASIFDSSALLICGDFQVVRPKLVCSTNRELSADTLAR